MNCYSLSCSQGFVISNTCWRTYLLVSIKAWGSTSDTFAARPGSSGRPSNPVPRAAYTQPPRGPGEAREQTRDGAAEAGAPEGPHLPRREEGAASAGTAPSPRSTTGHTLLPPRAASFPECAREPGCGPASRYRRRTERVLRSPRRPEESRQRRPGRGNSRPPRRALTAARAPTARPAVPVSGDVAMRGRSQGRRRAGEEERGEQGRQTGERKVREAWSGSETREPVRHCGPEERRAREGRGACRRRRRAPSTGSRARSPLSGLSASGGSGGGWNVTRPRAAANCCECTGRGPGGGGGSSRVAVKNVSH